MLYPFLKKIAYFNNSIFFIFILQAAAQDIPEAVLVKKNVVSHSKKIRPIASLNRKQLRRVAQPNLSTLLANQSVVKISQTNANPHQQAIDLRGFGNNAATNSLLLIDGFPILNASLLAPNLNQINLSDIQSFHIYPGSEAVLWGNQAVGGVVDLTTIIPEKFSSEGNIGLGNQAQRIFNAWLANRFNNNLFVKMALTNNATNNDREHAEQRFQQVMSQIGKVYDNGLFWLKFHYFEDVVNLPGPLTEAEYLADFKGATTPENVLHDRGERYQFYLKHHFSSIYTLETRVSFQDIQTNGFVYLPFIANDRDFYFSPRLLAKLANSNITLGYDFVDSDYQDINQQPSRASANEYDEFIEWQKSLFKDLSFTLGGRLAKQNITVRPYESESTDGGSALFVSEQQLTYSPGQQWQLFIKRAGNFRFAKADELLWMNSNADTLLPQRGVSYELGGDWQQGPLNFTFNLYQLILNNEIAYDPTKTSTQPFGNYKNLAKTRRDGILLNAKYHFNENLDLRAQTNFVDARFIAGPFQDHFIPAIPAFQGNLGLDYRFLDRWQFSYTAVYNGKQYPTDDDLNQQNKISGYWLHNISLQYLLKELTVSVMVNNMFNQRYSAFTDYSTKTLSNTYYPGLGRTFLLSIRVNTD